MPEPWKKYQQAPEFGPWNAYAEQQKQVSAAPNVSREPSSISYNDVVRSAARGVPIIGGVLNKLNAATNATLAPVIDPLLPDSFEKLNGSTWGQRYDQALQAQNRADATFQREHPIASTASEIAGGVASTGGLGTTALGARALGLTGTTLPGQIGRGLLSGALIGSADSAVRGEDPLVGGAIGGAGGAVAPVVGRVVSAAARPVINTIRGIRDPAGEAARRVAAGLDRDILIGSGGLTPQEYAAARGAGVPVNLMDIGGETTRAIARSAANTEPSARATLNTAIDNRFEGQANRMTDWLRQTFHYPDAAGQRAAIDAEQARVVGPAYRAARAAGDRMHPNGLWSPELERLTSSPDVVDAMRSAAQRGGGRAVAEGGGGFNPGVTFENGIMHFPRGQNGGTTYPDLQFWDYTFRNVRDAADRAFRAGENSLGSSLRDQATAIRNELDRLVPQFGAARNTAAGFFGAENALEAGQNFVTSRMRNAEARDAIQRMTQNERQLFADGFVDRYIQAVRETPDRRNVLNQIANNPAARERIALAVGPQRARELEAFLHVERIMDSARPAVQGNSTTARQLAELSLAGGAYGISGGDWTSPQRLMNAALVYGAARGNRVIDQRVAREVARLLVSSDPTVLNRGIRLLANNPRFLGALRLADDNIAAVAARGSSPTAAEAAQ